MRTSTVCVCIAGEDLEVECDWCWYPPDGDGWNTPHTPGEVEVIALRIDGRNWVPGDSVWEEITERLEEYQRYG